MRVFLASIPLDGARVVVVGGGEPAIAKLRLFLTAPSRLDWFTPDGVPAAIDTPQGAPAPVVATPERGPRGRREHPVEVTVQALPASYGDALLVTYGDEKDPSRLLIDAGPANAFKSGVRAALGDHGLREVRTDRCRPGRLDDCCLHGCSLTKFR